MKKKNILNIKKIDNIDLIPNYYHTNTAAGISTPTVANGDVAFAKQKADYTNNLINMCSSDLLAKDSSANAARFEMHLNRKAPQVQTQPASMSLQDEG